MKRSLLSQMAHDWKNNVWLVIELAIVALAIWAILTMIWIHCKGLTQPLGFNPKDVYTLDVKSVPETSPYFITEYKDNFFADRNELVRRLRNNPNVEAVSLHNNFAPFEYNYAGNYFKVEDWSDSIGYSGNVRQGEPDIIKVLQITSITGKSQDELKEMLSRKEILLSPNEDLESKIGPLKNYIGKKMYVHDKSEEGWKIGDIVEKVKRSDYEYFPSGVMIIPYKNINEEWGNIILRVKAGKALDFMNDFNSDPSLSKLRNVYLSNLESLVKKGETLNQEVKINIRLMVAISFFLLVTIFLGLLGSFWFRVQQRVSEIAIRKTFGAKNSDLFRRILGEGMVLLTAALFLISSGVWPFIQSLSDFIGEKWWFFLALEGITAGVLALGIVISLWYPACRAMHIEPAIAVKAE